MKWFDITIVGNFFQLGQFYLLGLEKLTLPEYSEQTTDKEEREKPQHLHLAEEYNHRSFSA